MFIHRYSSRPSRHTNVLARAQLCDVRFNTHTHTNANEHTHARTCRLSVRTPRSGGRPARSAACKHTRALGLIIARSARSATRLVLQARPCAFARSEHRYVGIMGTLWVGASRKIGRSVEWEYEKMVNFRDYERSANGEVDVMSGR